jgi:exodeoxyribonuclease V alpha subunit
MTTRRAQLGLPLFDGYEAPADVPGKVAGVCHAVLYADLQTGFTVAELVLEGGGKGVVAGKGDPFSPGDRVEAEGRWETDSRFGRQFKASYLRARVPETAEGIARYVASGAVPGIGAKTAERLLQAFGERLPEAIQSPPALVAAGLTEVRAKALTEHWKVRTRHGRLLSFLYSVGAGPALARRLLEAYGEEAYRILLTDPYRPAREVHGVGFRTADRIALSQGMAKESPARLRAALVHEMGEIEREGHCAAPRMGLVARVAKALVVREAPVEAELERLLVQGELVEERLGGRPVIWRAVVRQAEVEAAKGLFARIGPSGTEAPEGLVGRTAIALGLPPLDPGQAAAVRLALAERVSVLTGNPGTGKTSTVSVLLGCLRALDPGVRILLAAPTGRAAKRLTEQTGVEAATIHRLLVWSPETRRFTKGPEDPLACDAIVVDESSMLDLFLFRDLLRALPLGCRIVFVGDVDQLPSVGAGAVLADMIRSKAVPVARLTRIFRQGAGSRIAAVSQRINAGQMPRLDPPQRGADMWGQWAETPAEAAAAVISLATERIPEEGFDPLRDLQVLAPGHQGEAGVAALNKALQARLNPPSPKRPEISWKDRIFRLGDRVIQTSNSYELDVFNGDIGFVVGISGSQALSVDFDGRVVCYEGGALTDLQLAYAITIHKSQGSEFPAVIVLCTTQHFLMLRRNLLYTGVSRARRLCVLVGQQRAVGIAARKGDVGRTTGLASRLSALALTRGIPLPSPAP